jgi:hypothetical protein
MQGRGNPIHLRDRKLTLISAAASEDDVAFAEAKLGADYIATFAPSPDMQAAGVEIVQSYIDFLRCIYRFNSLVDAVRKSPKWKPLPHPTVKKRKFGPILIGSIIGKSVAINDCGSANVLVAKPHLTVTPDLSSHQNSRGRLSKYG